MAKKIAQPESVTATCSECGHVGRAGGEVAPYSFAKGDHRWLCAVSQPRQCLLLAWNKFKAECEACA